MFSITKHTFLIQVSFAIEKCIKIENCKCDTFVRMLHNKKILPYMIYLIHNWLKAVLNSRNADVRNGMTVLLCFAVSSNALYPIVFCGEEGRNQKFLYQNEFFSFLIKKGNLKYAKNNPTQVERQHWQHILQVSGCCLSPSG